MPSIPPLPQSLAPVLPFISLIVVDWLKHSTQARWINISIALIVPLFLASLWALLSHALSADIWGDIGIIVAISYGLMALPDMAGLRTWLQSTLVSPAALFARHPQPEPTITATAGPAVPYQSPQGINLRSSRVSRVPFDSSFHPLPSVWPTGPTPAVKTQETPTPAEPPTPVEESPAQS